MQTHLVIIGILFIVLALIHFIFPKYFEWEKEFKSLSLINRQIMKVHTIFIGLTVFLMGLLCFTSSHELIETSLGMKITLGLAIFWTIRLIIQFFGYSSKLWKGKIFETIIHVIFSLLWVYISFVFWIIYFNH
ncbi:hypothetical protein K0U91_13345 [Chryseobacterium chendengshani]|uniref:hypothetical protein n=1 Tax=Chryseobacterium sp. LJ668 TaxID=2864040 RepID=UPI001C68B1EC|nr:hypothetical protein [Chryseobacterium sp. LJ668]MBW8522488.1 hypothetical protein [Chryseobacterium sp. LJ668]QYK16029.1 hypothetical protein K0U91_13345 [Chryseobacterium sp. LJ668]